MLGIAIKNGVATVDLTSEYQSGGGSRSMQARLAQVVYTLTQFPTVHAVRFHLDGTPVNVFSGQGIVLNHPVGRADYQDLLPPIVVEKPASGARVSSGAVVSGTANVFEANVGVEVLDRNGTRAGEDVHDRELRHGLCRQVLRARALRRRERAAGDDRRP